MLRVENFVQVMGNNAPLESTELGITYKKLMFHVNRIINDQ